MENQRINPQAVATVFATPVLLGMAPIFGKFAINTGADPFSVAALRTIMAVAILWLAYVVLFRKYIFIYPAGLMGCIVIGAINGIGSLFYYGGLGILDASLAQLINGMYLVFAVMLARIGGQETDMRTLLRVGAAILALAMITGLGTGTIDWTGVGFMLANALMFAGTVTLSQYVLYEMPAPTATLYILSTMAVVVTVVWLAVGQPMSQEVFQNAMPPIILLGLSTALSRLAMFAGVKFMGGMQTAVLAITEIAVAVTLAMIFLGDTLTPMQWFGVAILGTTLLLVRQKDLLPRGYNPNALIVANMSSVQFQRIAFHRAFGTSETDNEFMTMESITTQEMQAIQAMMGASIGGLDPFPIGKSNKINKVSTEAMPPYEPPPSSPVTSEVDKAESDPRRKSGEFQIPPDLFKNIKQDEENPDDLKT